MVAGSGVIGVSERQLRRRRKRYEEEGYEGLLDRRRGSQQQTSGEEAAEGSEPLPGQVLRSERAPFHEKLGEDIRSV